MSRARDEHRELVSGEPARDRVLVELGLDPARERLETRVARLVPERVVDVLEAVDVEIEQRDVLMRFLRPRDRLLQEMLELHAVRELRQRIEAREITDTLLDAFAL